MTALNGDAGEIGHAWPEVLPDGDTVLFTIYYRNQSPRLARLSLETGAVTRLPIEGSAPRYSPTGHVLYIIRDDSLRGTVCAVPFDLSSREFARSNPVCLVENVDAGTNSVAVLGNFGLANNGTLVYVTRTPLRLQQYVLAMVDRTGRREPLDVPPARYRAPRVSPDGTEVAVEVVGEDGRSDIWVYDLRGRRGPRRSPVRGIRPLWTSDGSRITFASDHEGTWGIYWLPANFGGGGVGRLTTAEDGVQHWPDSWSHDGRTLAFTKVEGASYNRLPGILTGVTSLTLWTVTFDDHGRAGAPELLVPDDATAAAFAPGGRWIAYRENAPLGLPGVYVQPFPPTGERYRVGGNAGSYPMWSRDDTELFYRVGTREDPDLVRVHVKAGAAFEWGDEAILPIDGFAAFFAYRDYDILPDGRFVTIIPAGEARSAEPPDPRIHVVLNWLEELKQRVPAR